MKKKIMAASTLIVLVLIVGVSLAWFLSTESKANEFKFGTIQVEVLEPGFNDIYNAQVGSYDKNIKVVSHGTKRTYVRVRLVPEWSEPSLPISNVQLNMASNNDWIYSDGYYYFKYYLTENQETSLLLDGITLTSLGPEYEGETLTIKVVAEGAQITNEAWKDIWGITSLPFTPELPWN